MKFSQWVLFSPCPKKTQEKARSEFACLPAWLGLVDFNKIFIISCACAYLESINVKVVWQRCNRSNYKCSAMGRECLQGEREREFSLAGAMKLWGSFHMPYINMNDDDLGSHCLAFSFKLCKSKWWLLIKQEAIHCIGVDVGDKEEPTYIHA